jgi:hypothetical protein
MPMQRVFVVVVALGIVSLLGCAAHKGEITPAPGVYPTPGELRFSVKITPQKFALGEPVALEASLFNGNRDVFEKKFRSGCTWDYEIAASDGHVVGPSRMCAMAETELRLEPGELRMIMRNWKGKDDYFGVGEPLSPGRYSVTAGFVDEYTRVVPMAEPVWIEIVESKR